MVKSISTFCSAEAERDAVGTNRDESETSQCGTNASNINGNPAMESKVDTRKADFEIIYAEYLKKRGKARVYQYYRGFVSKEGRFLDGERYRLTPKQIYIAVYRYVEEKQQEGTDIEFYKNFDTLLNKGILDYVEVNENE